MKELSFGLSVTALGMIVVFVGLIVLILCVKAISKVTAMKQQQITAPAPRAAEPMQRLSPAPQGIAPEVMAAITAAIATVWQGETGFVVRHVKRVHNAPAWNHAGREEQTYSRF